MALVFGDEFFMSRLVVIFWMVESPKFGAQFRVFRVATFVCEKDIAQIRWNGFF